MMALKRSRTGQGQVLLYGVILAIAAIMTGPC
jgi:hypothetical protein